MPDVRLVPQFIGQALHIVVVREGIEPGVVAEPLQTAHGVCDLKIVVVVVAAPQALVQLIVGNGMEHFRVGPAAVIAVDDLAHQPEFRLDLVGKAAQALHKVEVQHIRCIQPDAVNVECIDPKADGIIMVVLHLGVALIQLDQQVEAAPVAVRKTVVVLVVAPEVHIAEPVLIAGILAVGLQIFEGKEIPAHMVEHTVHNDLLAPGVAVGHELLELFVGAQTAVHPAVVDGIVAVGAALKQRADVDGCTAQLCRVGCPCFQLCKSARGGLAVVFVRTAAQPQRIDVIKYCFVIPSHDHSLPFYCSKKLHRPQGGSNSIPHPLANMCIFADFCQDSLRLSATVPVKRRFSWIVFPNSLVSTGAHRRST